MKKLESHESCPKCGSYSVRVRYIGRFQIVCIDCGHSGQLEETKECAMTQWNREGRAGN